MRNFWILAAFLLVGCVTPREAQIACERSSGQFLEMVDCLKDQHAKANGFGWSRDTDLISLYMAYADALAVKVRAGQMEDNEARLNLAEMYSRMTSISQERTAVGAASYANVMSGLAAYEAASQPARSGITCSQVGKFWNCW